jgi:hypothetical protein
MKPRCETSKYYRSHLKLPRGRGSWAFQEYVPVGSHPDDKREILFATGTYAETKRIALNHFQTLIEVLP